MSRKPKIAKPVSAADLFRKIANEKVVVDIESGPKRMTRWEALVRSVQHQALNKDASAIRLLSQMRKKFPGKTACGGPILVLTENQMNY